MRSQIYRASALAAALVAAATAYAWDAHGHRTVTYLALDGLPAGAPTFLRDAVIRNRLAFESHEADRWRGSHLPYLAHENSPDHYMDVDHLPQFGLTLETLPPLRYDYVKALAIAKHDHPERVDAYDAEKDQNRVQEWPGFLPYAIVEHYSKLQSCFNTLRTLEKLNDPARRHELEQTRENIIYHMGLLSHFVGDAAQPLHTTLHYNGWIGENPDHYTTSKRFHAHIDGEVLEKHGLGYESLRGELKFTRRVDARDPWKDTLAFIARSRARVEELYKLERDRQLDNEPGKKLISEQLCDGAEMLAAYYSAAWNSAAPDDKQLNDYKRYDNLKPPPTSQPAGPAATDGSAAGDK